VVAVGDAYTTWEGYKDEATGETKIGVSYAQLCKDVKEGGRILVADGAVTIQVSLLNGTEASSAWQPPAWLLFSCEF
jgi:pyruvate kinase